MPLQTFQRLVGSVHPEGTAVAAEQGAVELHEVYPGHVVGMVMGQQYVVEFAQIEAHGVGMAQHRIAGACIQQQLGPVGALESHAGVRPQRGTSCASA